MDEIVVTKRALYSMIIVLTITYLCDCGETNVCKTVKDYSNMKRNPNCYYNSDVNASPEELANRHGMEFKRHAVETEDNYILTLFRINFKSASLNRQPIFIHHGLLTSALSFMKLGNRSLAFALAKEGYDVWLGNNRGNSYSSKHRFLKITDPKFWDFSFHEISVYDIPASLEYITANIENPTKIIYLGHSMGTTIGFIYSSVKKDHAEQYLKGMVQMGPTAGLKYSNFNSVVRVFIMNIVIQLRNDGATVLFPYPERFRDVMKRFCGRYMETCATIAQLIAGPEDGELLPELLPQVFSFFPMTSSMKCLEHYVQWWDTTEMKQFDYGFSKNLKIYNFTTSPKYDLSLITIPIHMFYGKNDAFAPEPAVREIYDQLSVETKSMILTPSQKIKFNHLDFLSANHVDKYFHKPLLKVLHTLE